MLELHVEMRNTTYRAGLDMMRSVLSKWRFLEVAHCTVL